MQKLLIAALSASLFVSTAVSAADSTLAPGKPAGVRVAQEHDNTLLFVGLAVAAAVIIGVAASSGSSSTPAPAPVVTPSTGTA